MKRQISSNSQSYDTKKRERTTNLEFSEEQCHQLISEVEKHECLWDITSPNYKKRNLTQIAWESVSEATGIPKNDVLVKWGLLRQQFRNAFNKERRYKSGMETTSYRQANPYYNAMMFMAPTFVISAETCDVNMSSSSSSPPSPLVTQTSNTNDENNVLIIKSELDVSPPIKKKKQTPRTRNIERLSVSDSTIEMSNVVEPETTDDLWGRLIAKTLKTWPNKAGRRGFRLAIIKAFTKLENGDYDDPILSDSSS